MNWVRAALALSLVLFVPGLVEQFEAPKVAAVRTCGLAALAGWLLAWPWRRRRPSALELAVLAWLGVEALATAFSVSPRLSLFGSALQRDGLLTSFALAGLFLAARDPLREPRAFPRTANVALAAMAVACVYALLQVARLDPFHWSHTALYGGVLVRPFGTLGHPNLLGAASAAALAWALAFALQQPARRWIHGPALALFAVTSALTFSRAAWLGAAAGSTVVLALVAREHGGFRARPKALALVALGIAALLALFWLGGWGHLFSTRAGELARAGESGSSRVEIWRAALAAWRERPILGQGPDTFELVFPRVQTAAYWRHEWAGLPFHAHSVYLHALATRGLAGLLAQAAVTLLVLRAARRAWRAGGESRARVPALLGGLAALATAGLTGALGIGGALWTILTGAALDAAGETAGPPRPNPRAQPRAPSPWRDAAPAASWVVAAAVAVFSLRELAASHDVAMARRGGQDPAGALAFAERANALAPLDDGAAQVLAEARLAAANWSRDGALLAAAERAAERAIELEPVRSLHWQELGAVRAARALAGDPSAISPMEAAYARAIDLAPQNALAMAELARWEIMLGRPAAGIAPARRAVGIYPREAALRVVLAATLVGAGDRKAARAELVRALGAEWRGRIEELRSAEEVLRVLELPVPRQAGTP